MAVVNSNPGHGNETFVTKYQNLLKGDGTKVMRKLFDHAIGAHSDFGRYLKTNVNAENTLKSLIKKGEITLKQQEYLPPRDKNPLSSNFDMSLLFCLLRNVCGLRDPNHSVWEKPDPTDHSCEAELTRLIECSNDAKMNTQKTDLAEEWNKLTGILNRLNKTSGFQNLSISNANEEYVYMEQECFNAIEAKLDKIIGDFTELKNRNQSEMKDLTSKIDQDMFEIKQTQSKMQKDMSEIKQVQLKEVMGKLTELDQKIQQCQSDKKQSDIKLQESLKEIKQSVSNIRRSQSKVEQDQSVLKQGQKDAQEDRDKKQETTIQEFKDTQQDVTVLKELDPK